MTSLRERLEAKQRRRRIVPIQVSDPSQDQTAWVGVAAALEVERRKDEPDPTMLANLQGQLEAAEARAREHYVDVELQALSAAEWEAAQSEWVDDDGDMVWAEALAPLLEASCVDEELRDAGWWREQMARDAWSEGDTHALRAALLELNVYAVESRAPKD